MSKRLAAVLISVLAIGLFAAGCGGDDDETSTTTTTSSTTGTSGATGATGASADTSTKEGLIAAADKICAEGDKEIEAEAQETFSGGQPSPQEAQDFVTETVVPNIQKQLDQLRELDPPEADAEEFTAIIDEAQSALDELEKNPDALNPQGSGDDPFAEVNKKAQQFGLTSCGGS